MAHAAAILHLTSAIGGGIDRYIRDIAASVPGRHLIWHAGDSIDALEDVRARVFTPLADVEHAERGATAIDAWRRARGVGLVHLHGADARTRQRFAMIDAAVPAVATLHDVGWKGSNKDFPLASTLLTVSDQLPVWRQMKFIFQEAR